MTSYIAITDAETDPEAPLTSELAKKWRDNPIAIAEGDATVPESLRNTQLLGTLTTTSGSTQTLSGLVLTPFRSLWISVQGVSGTSTSILRFASPVLNLTASFGAGGSRNGYIQMDLTSGGAFLSNLSVGGTSSEIITTPVSVDVYVGRTGYTTATTSIGFSLSAGTFDAGTIAFYGVK